MNVWQLAVREVAHRRLSFALPLLSVTVGVGSLVAALTSLWTHDRRTREILARKEDDLRQPIGKMTEFAQNGGSVLVVTHDASAASRTDRALHMDDGKMLTEAHPQ